ncbi:MAG: DUF808 domain-containing protein [Gordonia sp. (in: high G+C Gram-positive bacteria)]|uniref:DUF808 domain-containing protein n=1 Tax=Gordonia sp. (in: high G+C Gram-positive bacteria) TaxID=84139 RepID=UPI0039E47E2B
MAGGLAALLDDVAALVKLTAASVDDIGAAAGKAGTKAVGVIVDDAAVTPRYVQGIKPARELAIVGKIARGSIRNKLVFILPAIMLLSQFASWALTPLLMVGGTYLCFEGAEKIWEKLSGGGHEEETPVVAAGGDAEKELVGGAVRTDFILSAEIMVIALSEIAGEGFWLRLGALVIVAILITALVYGAVAAIVKMDDVGLMMARRDGAASRRIGRWLLRAMPMVMAALSFIGTIAMLWVGGHILLVGIHDLGWDPLYDFVHHLETAAAEATGAVGGFIGWLVNTFFSAVLGFIVGSVVVGIVHLVKHRTTRGDEHPLPTEPAAPEPRA